MKITVLHIQTSKETWAEEAEAVYLKKLKNFCDFELRALKSTAHARSQNEEKREKEAQRILTALDPAAHKILLDEKGKVFQSSLEWSRAFVKPLESGQPLQLILGGAFGVSSEVRKNVNQIWSLSSLTFNHHLARIVLLEQIYRGFTIWKGLPYHN